MQEGRLDPEALRTLLASAWGLHDVTLSPLPGENHNWLVGAPDGSRFALKVTRPEEPEVAGAACGPELEHAAVEHLADAGIGLDMPRTVSTRDGTVCAPAGRGARARLTHFVEGLAWGEHDPLPDRAALADLGTLLARLALAFEGFGPGGAARTHRWDPTAASQHRASIPLVPDAARRHVLERAFLLWHGVARPCFEDLPRGFIHADVNDENVLLQGGRIVSLLDFGDSLEAPLVCDLAIALAYAMLDREDPLAAGQQVCAAYMRVRTLSEAEHSVLFPLVLGRLATTAAVAAQRRERDAGHATWFVTEERAWALLERLVAVDPVDVGAALAGRDNTEPRSDPDELLAARRRHIGPSLSLAYAVPLNIVRGAGQYLHDHRGRPHLDLVNNVCHVGHCHPRVVAAGQRQMARLNTNTRYLYAGLTAYAERLAGLLPDPLEVCFFVNSGSEANELALRLARTVTGRHDVVVVDGAYHGNTAGLIDISPYKSCGPGGRGSPDWVHVTLMPDGFRGPHRGSGSDVGRAYGNDVGRVIGAAGSPVAAFIAEPLLGCGGQVIPPGGWLASAYGHVRAAGGLCIADEVQVGFGRVGSHVWAFQREEVVPDIVVMGKPIGNGHPLSAVVTTRPIADAFANGMEYFSTFGGNPVSCAIGMAVLDVIEEEGLQERARVLGHRFLDGLRELSDRHPLIGDVRGAGLFLGVELVRDQRTLEPAAAEATVLVDRMAERGILLSTDGPLHNVLKIKPPMVLDQHDVDMTLRCLDDELSALA